MKRLLEKGPLTCLESNFKASAMGCKVPTHETLFGPNRNCLKARILRSRRVMKATFSKVGIRIKKKAANFVISRNWKSSNR